MHHKSIADMIAMTSAALTVINEFISPVSVNALIGMTMLSGFSKVLELQFTQYKDSHPANVAMIGAGGAGSVIGFFGNVSPVTSTAAKVGGSLFTMFANTEVVDRGVAIADAVSNNLTEGSTLPVADLRRQ